MSIKNNKFVYPTSKNRENEHDNDNSDSEKELDDSVEYAESDHSSYDGVVQWDEDEKQDDNSMAESDQEEEEEEEEEGENTIVKKKRVVQKTRDEMKEERERKKENKEDDEIRQEREKISNILKNYPGSTSTVPINISRKDIKKGLTQYEDFIKYVNTKKIFKISSVEAGGFGVSAPSGNLGKLIDDEIKCILYFKNLINGHASNDTIKKEIIKYTSKNKENIPGASDVLYNFYVGYPTELFINFITQINENTLNRIKNGIRISTLYTEFNNINYQRRIGYNILNALIILNKTNNQDVINFFSELKDKKIAGGDIESTLIKLFDMVNIEHEKLEESIVSLLLILSTKSSMFINNFLETYEKYIKTKYPFEYFFEFYAKFEKQLFITSKSIQPPVSSTFSRNIMAEISKHIVHTQPAVPEYKLKSIAQVITDLKKNIIVKIEDKPTEDLNYRLIENIIEIIRQKLNGIIPEFTDLFLTKMSDIIAINSTSSKDAHSRYELLKGIFKFSTKLKDNDNINFPKYVEDMNYENENVDEIVVNIIEFISKFKYPEVTIRGLLAKFKLALVPRVKVHKPPLFITRTHKPKYMSLKDDTNYTDILLNYAKSENVINPPGEEPFTTLFDTSIKLNVFYFALEELKKVLISINPVYEDGLYATLIIKEIENKLVNTRRVTLYDFAIELYELIIFLNKSIMRQLSHFVFINRVGLGYYSAANIINMSTELKCPELFNPVNSREVQEIATEYLKKYFDIFIVGFVYKVLSIDSFAIMSSEFIKIINVMNSKFNLESPSLKHILLVKNTQQIKQFLKHRFRMTYDFNFLDFEKPISVLERLMPLFTQYKKYSGVIKKTILPEYQIKNFLIYDVPSLTFMDTAVLSSYFDGNTIYINSGSLRTKENIMMFEKYYIIENEKIVGKFVNIDGFYNSLKMNSVDRYDKFPDYLKTNISMIRFPPHLDIYERSESTILFDTNEQTILKNIKTQEKEQKLEMILSLKSDKNLFPDECNPDDYPIDSDLENLHPGATEILSYIPSGTKFSEPTTNQASEVTQITPDSEIEPQHLETGFSSFSKIIKFPVRNNSEYKIKYNKLKTQNLPAKCSTCKKENINSIKSFHKKNDEIKNINFCSTKCMKKYSW